MKKICIAVMLYSSVQSIAYGYAEAGAAVKTLQHFNIYNILFKQNGPIQQLLNGDYFLINGYGTVAIKKRGSTIIGTFHNYTKKYNECLCFYGEADGNTIYGAFFRLDAVFSDISRITDIDTLRMNNFFPLSIYRAVGYEKEKRELMQCISSLELYFK